MSARERGRPRPYVKLMQHLVEENHDFTKRSRRHRSHLKTAGCGYSSPYLRNLSRKVEGFMPTLRAAAVLLPP